MEAGLFEGEEGFGGTQAALGDMSAGGREVFEELEGVVDGDREVVEVSVVDADDVDVGAEGPLEFFAGVDFEEDFEVEAFGEGGEGVELGGFEGACDQQDGVSTDGAGFDDLVLIDGKVLAQDGAKVELSCGAQVVIGAGEEVVIGEDGEGGGPGLHIADGEGLDGDVRVDGPLGGGLALDLGDDAGLFGVSDIFFEGDGGGGEVHALFEEFGGVEFFVGLEFFLFVGEYFVEDIHGIDLFWA